MCRVCELELSSVISGVGGDLLIIYTPFILVPRAAILLVSYGELTKKGRGLWGRHLWIMLA